MYNFKVMFLGACGTDGKTSLIKRALNDAFVENMPSTNGALSSEFHSILKYL